MQRTCQVDPSFLYFRNPALVPHAKLVMMEGSGHLPFLEEPGPTFALLADFLRAPLPK